MPQTTLQQLTILLNEGRLQELRDLANGFPIDHPDAAAVCNYAGAAQAGLQRLEEALALFDLSIQVQPRRAETHCNRGAILARLGRTEEAIASYDTALRLDADCFDTHYNRGNALQSVGRHIEAAASFDHALRLQPNHARALNNNGVALWEIGHLDRAITSFGRAFAVNPSLTFAAAQMLYLKAQIGDWSEDGIDPAQLGVNGDKVPALPMLAMDDDPGRQLKRSQAQISVQAPDITFPKSRRPGRLRIGYFSADFHGHATMSVLAGMFEKHDRKRFEVHAFSYGPHTEDTARQRLLGAVEHFHDVRSMGDAEIATLARDRCLDVAVDIKGYTKDGRPEILAYRAAPVQMLYMGFPGPAGQPFIDYVIADKVVIPPENRPFFTEKVAYLPDCYFVNDDQRRIGEGAQDRAEHGLPEDAFVFCCFNQTYKISPAEFDIWMRLLGRVEGSVLWLLKDNQWAEANLRQEATARGIDPDRLIFAAKLPEADHLARHRCADLMLDTFRVNAHTTACDALWTGLPVVTLLGRSFAGRVCGSLLNAIGLPELVTTTLEAYEALALDLALDPQRLGGIKAKLAANRMTTPLFDTERFTRNMEQTYEAAFDRYLAGQSPSHLEIATPTAMRSKAS